MSFSRRVEDGTEIKVIVITRSSASGIAGEFNGRLRIRLNSPPVDGAANKELIKLLSKSLKVAKSRIEIVRGETSRRKTVRIKNMNPAALCAGILAKKL